MQSSGLFDSFLFVCLFLICIEWLYRASAASQEVDVMDWVTEVTLPRSQISVQSRGRTKYT